ncbi:porphobilinogen synthase [Clostridium acidisoli DSM 12555]|uniref:Delta-aminolevulinic acid dehydratase n=1 Tax=Clostridium acidisoli DSM 12555 TaxID=1121291 RepID=A0A1W1XY36_9CLOT|nr:porphobilinogen synthase [Clostridium acidisoli]SMC28879.1 porphobilinogen synthase [Clostridium acidisoli DSM 12555]
MFRRHRRLRENQTIRSIVRETVLNAQDFIYPMFVVEGQNIKREIRSLPNNFHWSLDRIPELIEDVTAAGVKGIMIFGLPDHKDEVGHSAYDENGIVQRAIGVIKKLAPELWVITDVCMCEYTSHGHCGIIVDQRVDNDETLKYIAQTALSHVKAGADMVAPSDMMDGRVEAIRKILDENGYKDVGIMAYSAKYSSAFYGPFREAADSTPQFGDRKSYQMDPANIREAMLEIEDDINEGADIIMVKPALSYLDVIRWARDKFNHPVAAYSVSGEFAMVKAAASLGLIDEKAIALEMLTSIKRAGADIIITYYAMDAARWIKE